MSFVHFSADLHARSLRPPSAPAPYEPDHDTPRGIVPLKGPDIGRCGVKRVRQEFFEQSLSAVFEVRVTWFDDRDAACAAGGKDEKDVEPSATTEHRRRRLFSAESSPQTVGGGIRSSGGHTVGGRLAFALPFSPDTLQKAGHDLVYVLALLGGCVRNDAVVEYDVHQALVGQLGAEATVRLRSVSDRSPRSRPLALARAGACCV